MKNYLILGTLLSLLASCSGKEADTQANEIPNDSLIVEDVVEEVAPVVAPTTSYNYTIEAKEESSMPLPDGQQLKKIRYTVQIPSEYSKAALDEIADVIKSQEPIEYLFVEFYLPNQPRNSGNYGIAERTPDENSSTINYVAPPVEPEKPIAKPYDGCKVYGAWSMMGAKVIAYQKKGKCYMVNYYGGTNYGDPELYYKTTYRGHTAFKNAEDPDDMYVINSNGDLDGYAFGELACTFPSTSY